MTVVLVKRRKVARIGADPKTAEFIDGLTTYTIGSTFVGRQSYNPLARNPELEKNLFKQLLNIEPSDKDYKDKIAQYWKSLRVKIPRGGRKLNISFYEDNGVTYFDNPQDYSMYVFAINHPSVSPDEESCLKSSPIDKMYFIDDERMRKQKQLEAIEADSQAGIAFNKIVENENTVKHVLRLFNVNPDTLEDFDSCKTELYKFRQTKPKDFVEAVNNPNLKTISLIRALLDYGIIRKEGNAYFYLDVHMGNSQDSVIGWLNNQQNNTELIAMKSKLEAEKASKIKVS